MEPCRVGICTFLVTYRPKSGVLRALGRPDYFITMTCNTNWDEITQVLKPGEVPNDRPDIISRVFRMKLDALLDDLVKKGVYGMVIALFMSLSFKREDCHMHTSSSYCVRRINQGQQRILTRWFVQRFLTL